MRISDLQREENYNEYLRLLQDDDYLDVTYDNESGGVSAVHRLHKFAKQKGVNGMRQGDYERTVLEVLRNYGSRILLGAESNMPGIKSFDGFLNDAPMEIKTVEGRGIWAINTKLCQAEKQNAQCVVLFFPDSCLFSYERVVDGLGKYMANPSLGKELNIRQLIAVSCDGLLAVWHKKATPVEGWSVWEGFRRENGANSYTLSPSDAKV